MGILKKHVAVCIFHVLYKKKKWFVIEGLNSYCIVCQRRPLFTQILMPLDSSLTIPWCPGTAVHFMSEW